MQPHLDEGLLAIQFLFQPAQSFIDRLAFFQMHFRHIQGLVLILSSAERGEGGNTPSKRVKVIGTIRITPRFHNPEVFRLKWPARDFEALLISQRLGRQIVPKIVGG